MAVCGGRDVELGDVEHDLLAVGRQDPPLALVALLEGARVHARGRRVERRVLRGPELGAGVLKHDIYISKYKGRQSDTDECFEAEKLFIYDL